MDPARFDAVLRSLAAGRSRRGLLAALTGGLLAALHSPFASADADARRRRRRKKRNRSSSPPPPCANRVKDGAETDVDCGGGICPRCADGLSCNSRNDCQSAVCSTGSCLTCGGDFQNCGNDANGDCVCIPPATGGSNVCVKNSLSDPFASCGMCPDGMICVIEASGDAYCFKRCGS